jgi:hypothetical protein
VSPLSRVRPDLDNDVTHSRRSNGEPSTRLVNYSFFINAWRRPSNPPIRHRMCDVQIIIHGWAARHILRSCRHTGPGRPASRSRLFSHGLSMPVAALPMRVAQKSQLINKKIVTSRGLKTEPRLDELPSDSCTENIQKVGG